MDDNSDMIEYEINDEEHYKSEKNIFVKSATKKDSSNNATSKLSSIKDKDEIAQKNYERTMPLNKSTTRTNNNNNNLFTTDTAENLIPMLLSNIATQADAIINRTPQKSAIGNLINSYNNSEKKAKTSINGGNESKVNASKYNRARTLGNPLGFGERLYRKALVMKEEKEKRAQEMHIQNITEEKKKCSFQPKMSDESFLINVKVHKNIISLE